VDNWSSRLVVLESREVDVDEEVEEEARDDGEPRECEEDELGEDELDLLVGRFG
jgi:hypothetical protein